MQSGGGGKERNLKKGGKGEMKQKGKEGGEGAQGGIFMCCVQWCSVSCGCC